MIAFSCQNNQPALSRTRETSNLCKFCMPSMNNLTRECSPDSSSPWSSVYTNPLLMISEDCIAQLAYNLVNIITLIQCVISLLLLDTV